MALCALAAAGMRPGELMHNCFSHLVPAGMMFDLAARTLGCAVVPGGVGQTDIQLQTIADLKPVAYAGTPQLSKDPIEKAADGVDVSSTTCAAVGAEPFRRAFGKRSRISA